MVSTQRTPPTHTHISLPISSPISRGHRQRHERRQGWTVVVDRCCQVPAQSPRHDAPVQRTKPQLFDKLNPHNAESSAGRSRLNHKDAMRLLWHRVQTPVLPHDAPFPLLTARPRPPKGRDTFRGAVYPDHAVSVARNAVHAAIAGHEAVLPLVSAHKLGADQLGLVLPAADLEYLKRVRGEAVDEPEV